jgi:hypothetical protein
MTQPCVDERWFRDRMLRANCIRVCQVVVLTVVWTMTTASLALSQRADASPKAALDCFEQSRRDGEVYSACPPGIVSAEAIVGARDRYPAATYEGVLNGLERLALVSDDSRTRGGAVLLLGSLGDPRLKEPVADTVDRLKRIYEQSSNMRVRALIARSMCCQVATGQAVEFLKSVAKDNRPEDLSSDWPPAHWALTTLETMGPAGRAALQSLHAEGNVENARARSYLEYLSKHSFQEPR